MNFEIITTLKDNYKSIYMFYVLAIDNTIEGGKEGTTYRNAKEDTLEHHNGVRDDEYGGSKGRSRR